MGDFFLIFPHSDLGGFIESSIDPSAHGFALYREPVCVVNQSVQDGIGQGCLSDVVMPKVNGKLTGDQGGARTVTIFDDLSMRSTR
uniref:Uncharacterized protein n=1 Tax=Candidatus Kentrum sp. SD TaxID=2126332 RepID=A0A451BKW1_9GAMM|nr:MAG: hypothetical protein BECKSD772D_GA0070982_10304 [Candidatus Kentron sp. SD]